MILDNTPTVNPRSRKPDGHTRLRLEKAKETQKANARSKVKRAAAAKEKKSKEDSKDKDNEGNLQMPKKKQNVLSKPTVASSKFQKRQANKSWLPTHLFHAKRAHMTPPKEPLWRFAIPLTPTEKSYRPTHRAANDKGCVVWDTSYVSTIGVQGREESLLGLLRGMGVSEAFLLSAVAAKWKKGAHSWTGWLRERDSADQWISRVEIIWSPTPEVATVEKADAPKVDHPKVHGGAARDKASDERQTEDQVVSPQNDGIEDPQEDEEEDSDNMELPEPPQGAQLAGLEEEHETEPDHPQGDAQVAANQTLKAKEKTLKGIDRRTISGSKKKTRGRLFIRVHPSAFLQLWNEILKVAKMQRPQPSVEDLRFEIGSIKAIGPGASEALIGALRPKLRGSSRSRPCNVAADVWQSLVGVTSSAILTPGAVLGFNCSDPRLEHPPRTVKQLEEEDKEKIFHIITDWPFDRSRCSAEIFDRNARLTACRLLSSQKSINRRKGERLPGEAVSPSPSDPDIPVLVLAGRSGKDGNDVQGSWTVLVPWKCIQPIWYSLMYYPLSTGSTPRFGGLDEERQIAFERGAPWFPADFPGTKAGWEWELRERDRREAQWAKKPKGKRIEWDSLDLGGGKKGEIGRGWACDWERLFDGPPKLAAEEIEAPMKESSKTNKKKANPVAEDAFEKDKAAEAAPTPAYDLRHIPPSIFITCSESTSAKTLVTVNVSLIHRGVPTACARIYRLPTADPTLRKKWVEQAKSTKYQSKTKYPPKPAFVDTFTTTDASNHAYQAAQMSTLLGPLPLGQETPIETPRAGDPSYPQVPGEEDLIGFITTGNFNLGEGKGTGIGCLALKKVEGDLKNRQRGTLCIVREAGMSLGRIARWQVCG